MAKQKKSKMALYTRQDKIILYCGYALLGLFLLAIIVPMIYIVIASFMDPVTLQNKGISFDFSKWSLDAYQRVVSDKQIWVGFRNAVLYSIIFTIISVAVTMLAAYPMSLPDFKGKTIFNTLFVITMFFSGGLIPSYMVIQNLKMINTRWALLIPGAIGVYNLIVCRTFIINTIPTELLEASQIDGCSDIKYYFKVVIPLSKAILAVLVLFYGVGHWNAYFNAMIYLHDKALYPLTLFLREILMASQIDPSTVQDPELQARLQDMVGVIKYALIMVSMIPVLLIYPFVQKYFVKGVMIGSVKG